jgi:hypothetical protein
VCFYSYDWLHDVIPPLFRFTEEGTGAQGGETLPMSPGWAHSALGSLSATLSPTDTQGAHSL